MTATEPNWRYCLWGFHPTYSPNPLKIMASNSFKEIFKSSIQREKEGWEVEIVNTEENREPQFLPLFAEAYKAKAKKMGGKL